MYRWCLNRATNKLKVDSGKIEIISFVVKFSSHWVKPNKLHLWYPLFQVQCDRCDQSSHQTWIYQEMDTIYVANCDTYISVLAFFRFLRDSYLQIREQLKRSTDCTNRNTRLSVEKHGQQT